MKTPPSSPHCIIVPLLFLYVACILYTEVHSLLGTLNFVTLYSETYLRRIDNTSSSPISTYGGFPLETGTIDFVYVRTCKYIPLSAQLANCYHTV